MAYRISNADNTHDLMIDLVHNHVDKTPLKKKHAVFPCIMPDHDGVEELFDRSPNMKYANGLYTTLMARHPPDPEYWLSTPKSTGFLQSKYALYNIVMRKLGYPDEVYFGIAAATKDGHKTRMRHYFGYDPKEWEFRPARIKERIAEGWDLIHLGFVVWMDQPPFVEAPKFRLLMLAIESTLTFAFWGLEWSKTESHGGLEDFCLWDRTSIIYGGLCTHSSINEAVYSKIDLSVEELEAIRQEMDKRQKHLKHQSYVRLRGADVAAWNAHQAEYRRGWMEIGNNRQKSNESSRRSKKKMSALALATKKYYCPPCDKNYTKNINLQNHLTGKRHAQKLRELAKNAPLNTFVKSAGVADITEANKSLVHDESDSQGSDSDLDIVQSAPDKSEANESAVEPVASKTLALTVKGTNADLSQYTLTPVGKSVVAKTASVKASEFHLSQSTLIPITKSIVKVAKSGSAPAKKKKVKAKVQSTKIGHFFTKTGR